MKAYYARNRFVLFNLMQDMLLVVYVFTFGVSAARIILFYWLDTCMMLIFTMMFLKYINNIGSLAEVIAASCVAILINMIFMPFILGMTVDFNSHQEPWTFDKLLSPYFDVGFFLCMSYFAQAAFYKRMTSLTDRSLDMSYIVFMNSALSILLVGIAPLAAIFFVFVMNFQVSILLGFLVLRNLLDFWLVKRIRNKEMEAMG